MLVPTPCGLWDERVHDCVPHGVEGGDHRVGHITQQEVAQAREEEDRDGTLHRQCKAR